MSTQDHIHTGHRERLKERYLVEGLDNFNQINVLELLLFYCVQRKDTNPLAHRLIDRFGSLFDVLNASAEELMRVDGVTKHIATFISMISDLNRYCLVNNATKVKILTSTEESCKYITPFFENRKKETACRGQYCSARENSCLPLMREVARRAGGRETISNK